MLIPIPVSDTGWSWHFCMTVGAEFRNYAIYDSRYIVRFCCNVRLHGKGNKYRTVVIADATAKLVENYLSRYRSYAVGTDFLITNRYHRKIDRDGISYIIKKYVDAIRQKMQHSQNMYIVICFVIQKQCICWKPVSISSNQRFPRAWGYFYDDGLRESW